MISWKCQKPNQNPSELPSCIFHIILLIRLSSTIIISLYFTPDSLFLSQAYVQQMLSLTPAKNFLGSRLTLGSPSWL